ncbi:hypothetical protein [Paraburkholderia sp.]|uniref:hypothetical protein n=1 Tax=Paraburkholderia sp. TaxID=1926495 RepID=UPI00286F80C0|nr:hypothetical protein [Paraburkholderia sp.]
MVSRTGLDSRTALDSGYMARDEKGHRKTRTPRSEERGVGQLIRSQSIALAYFVA